MAKGLGNNYLLWVETATTGTYAAPKGQGNLKVSRSAGSVDLTSKTDYPYGLSAPGLRSVTLSCDIKPDLPDATGYTRLESLCAANPQAPFNIQIRKGGAGGVTGDVVFACSVYGNISGSDFSENAPVAVTLDLTLAAAPTVDTLAI